MICKVGFKQNVGHLGKEIVVCVVHGHNRTMKMEWPTVLEEFWDRLARKLNQHGVRFLAGDFNMALTQVVRRLRSRGVRICCCAWYPWRRATISTHNQYLGLDSCAIFHVGGPVLVNLTWGLDDVEFLAAVADDNAGEKDGLKLHVYDGQNCPGQPWHCYRNQHHKESDSLKDLSCCLFDLLEPSTAVAELERLKEEAANAYCPYLRLNQKFMDQSEWLSKTGQIHNGAHFPLCVFTKNASARSKAAAARRAEKGRNRRRWDDPAVAEARGKGGAAAEKGYTGKAFKGKGKFHGKRAGKG